MDPSPDPNARHAAEPHVRALGPPQSVPVFNCVVYVSRNAATGTFLARVANLSGVQTTGASEREALQKAVAAFKEVAARAVAAGEALPLITPAPLAPGETQRLIAVHL